MTRKLKRFLQSMMGVVLLAAPARAQETGLVQGLVVDAETGDPLISATVAAVNTSYGAMTNMDGRFNLRLPVGKYDLKVSYISYSSKTVTGVEVRANRPTPLNLSLKPEAIQMNEVEVSAKATQGTEAALLSMQKKSGVVTDGITSELMNHSGASDAGDALKRVTGVTVVGNRYVYVRGLGERYSSTQINGVQVPSPEPSRRVVPMDMFPADLIENIQTAKTFSPDQPGAFAGGAVQIVTREFPDQMNFSVTASGGVNSRTTFRQMLTYPGGRTDFLGFDDGRREMPGLIQRMAATQPVRARGRFSTTGFTADDIQALGRSFENVWSPRRTSAPANQSYDFSLGNTLGRGDRELGCLMAFSYGNDYESVQEERNTYRVNEGADGKVVLSPKTAYRVETTANNILWGGMFNSSLRLSPSQKVSLKTLYNRSAEDEAREYEGRNDDRSTDFRDSRLRYVERGLFSGQVVGEHHLNGLFKSDLTWRATLARATRNEPDNREILHERQTTGWAFREISQSGSRFFFDMQDDESGGALDWSFPFQSVAGMRAKLKVGGLLLDRNRDFDVRRFRFTPADNIQFFVDPSLSGEDLFKTENITPDRFSLIEATRPTDNYRASQRQSAGYLMIDAPLSRHLRFVGGVRVEKNHQTVTTFDPFAQTAVPIVSALENTDILPAVNLVYSLSDLTNLRVAFSRTLAHPDFRELAPFDFTDFVGGRNEIGNPDLRRTTIDNYDLRWEVFPRSGELMAFSLFYKRFHDPIEQVVQPTAEVRVTYANVPRANNYGVEFDFRRTLDFLAPGLKTWTFNTNFTVVRSRVDFPEGVGVQTSRRRPLQGQSPYVVNAILSYDQPSGRITTSLLYNVFGRRISEAGSLGLPDVYEQARHRVDFTFKQRLSSHVHAKLTAKNLLDNRVLFKQADAVYQRYRPGRTVSVGLGYKL